MATRSLTIAVIGACPAGIYASDLLIKSPLDIHIDLIDKCPLFSG